MKIIKTLFSWSYNICEWVKLKLNMFWNLEVLLYVWLVWPDKWQLYCTVLHCTNSIEKIEKETDLTLIDSFSCFKALSYGAWWFDDKLSVRNGHFVCRMLLNVRHSKKQVLKLNRSLCVILKHLDVFNGSVFVMLEKWLVRFVALFCSQTYWKKYSVIVVCLFQIVKT